MFSCLYFIWNKRKKVRPSVGRGRPSVGASSVGARSVVVPSLGSPRQPVPELSAAAKQAIAPDEKKTINGVIGMDFVYPSDLRFLRNDQDDRQKLLNDSVINVFCELILDRSRKSANLPNIHVFATRFGLGWKLGGVDKVQEWCRAPLDLFQMDLVFFPLNVNNNHWVLVSASLATKTIEYYDSMNNDGTESRKMVAIYLSQLHQVLHGNALDLNEWDSIDRHDIPQQENGFDCGVFVCQFAERLSRRAPFDFTQADMPAIRVRMIEEIVAGRLTPPSPRRPLSEHHDADNVRLYRELCDLRTENSVLREENAELKKKFENANIDAAAQLKDALITYRSQVETAKQKANEATERAETSDREATSKVHQAQAAEREATAKAERIAAEATAVVDLAQANEREAIQRVQTAERIAAELLEKLETERRNWDQIKTALEAEPHEAWNELRQLRTQPETASAQAPDRDAEEPATRPKTPRPTPSEHEHSTSSSSDLSETEDALSSSSSSSSSSSDDPPPDAANASKADRIAARRRKRVTSSTSPDDDVPLARRHRIRPPPSPHSALTQFLPESQSSDEGPFPRNQIAQVPPPPPQPIEFEEPEALALPIASNDMHLCINRPTTNVRDFPPILPPGVSFYRWLMARRMEINEQVEGALSRDLRLRRRFLMEKNLSQEDQQLIIAHVPPSYDHGNAYMRALAKLAMHSFDVIDPERRRELAFALLFCFSILADKSLDKFITRLGPF